MGKVEKVLLDTNALLLPYLGKVDVISNLREITEGKYLPLVLLDTVYEVLNKIARGTPSEVRKFRLALDLVEECIIVKSPPWPPNVDSKIVAYALENRCSVLTNDRELRRRLRRAGLSCIYYRESRKRLESDSE
ncbi:MAG: nucleotide-binding protein [Thermofilum sp. ex4484_15]|nr:MAG: nucleotide-binding protein [Thermofilum sp. ex4484_15]